MAALGGLETMQDPFTGEIAPIMPPSAGDPRLGINEEQGIVRIGNPEEVTEWVQSDITAADLGVTQR